MDSKAKCIVCGKGPVEVGNPPKWCSLKCKKKSDSANQPQTTQVQPEVKPESKPISKQESSKPEVSKVEAPKQEVIKKPKLCIQCQKEQAVHHLDEGSYCDNCKPEKKNICSLCKKETDAQITIKGKLYCDDCYRKVKKEIVTEGPKPEGVLNDPERLNFVHLYPMKKFLAYAANKESKASDQNVESSETIDFYECFQLHKDPTKQDSAIQWRIAHSISIPFNEIPDYYSGITKLPEDDIYLVTGGFNRDNSVSNIFYSIIFDRRVKPEKEETKSNEKETNLNIRNFKYCVFRDEKLTTNRGAHNSVVVGDFLYVFGGRTDVFDSNGNFIQYDYVKNCEKISISKVRSNMIKALCKPGHTEYDEKLKDWKFKPGHLFYLNEKWTSFGDLTEPRSNAMSFVYSKRIYIFGGYTGPKKLATKVEVFDTVEGKWSVLNVNHIFLASSLVLLDGDDAYIVGGSGVSGPSDEVVKWNLKTNEINKLVDLNSSRSGAHGTITTFENKKYLYVIGGRVHSVDFEYISLKDLNDPKGKFKNVDVKNLEFESEADADALLENYNEDPPGGEDPHGGKGTVEFDNQRKFNPIYTGLFDEGYVGENVVILPD